MSNLQGFFFHGTCVGFAQEPWSRNGKSGINYRLGISRTYNDKYGNPVTETTDLDVASDAVPKISKQVEALRGQPVLVRFVPVAKVGGRSGAFVTYFVPGDSELIPQHVAFQNFSQAASTTKSAVAPISPSATAKVAS